MLPNDLIVLLFIYACITFFQPYVFLEKDVYLSVTVRQSHVTDRPENVMMMAALILTPMIPVYRLLIDGVDLGVK